MKHISFSFLDKQAYNKALKESSKKSYTSQLIQIFTSTTKKSKLQNIVDKVNLDFPDALIIGATTAGEISNAKISKNSTIISLSLFEETKLSASYTKKIDNLSGKKISKEIYSKNTKAFIVLSEGLYGEDYEGFIKGIKQKNPKVLIAGGLAGDKFKLKKTFIIYKNRVLDKGALGVALSGKKLFAQSKYNLNYKAIGKKFTITSSQGRYVNEIDKENVLKIYKRYLGENIFDKSNSSLLNFPLLYRVNNIIVARTPIRVKEDSLVFTGAIQTNQEVQFGFSNTTAVVSDSCQISSQINQNSAEAIYIYSSMARKRVLKNTLHKEFNSFNAIAPTSGFFTYGEFYTTKKSALLLNCTTTLLVLSEDRSKNRVKNKIKKKKQQNLEESTFSTLTHFIQTTSTENKKNLELLNQYKTAVDMTSLISKTDTKGLITYVNETFCKTSQYSKNELLGKNHNILKDKRIAPQIFKEMWQTITNAKVWKGVISNRAKDGSIYYVDATIIPILNRKKEIVEYMAIRQDITKQIESKQRVEEKERLIKAIFDNQDSIVIYASKNRGMLSVNKKLFDYLAYANIEEFKKKHSCICDLFLDQEAYTNPLKYPNWIDDIANGTSDADKAKILIKDGTVHTFKILVKKMDDEYIINMYDITELEHALQQAHASEQAKSIFLANMSHEIRTPLNGILGFADILSNKNLDDEIKHYVEIMRKSGQTLLSVVNDILDFSKIESGELSLYKHEANLFEEMEAAVFTFASLSKKKQIEFYTYIDTKIPKTVICDIQRIKQVLNNLVSNAIKFTPKEGTVTIRISLEKIQNEIASIQFSVKDSGIGIAAEKQDLVFNSFSQADNSISREYGGTGLGLAISSQFVEMMDSKFKLKSEEGKGSEFSFTLELPIVNKNNALSTYLQDNQVKIQLLSSKDKEACNINDIIATYLNAWSCDFENIYDTKEINESSVIVIVCAKLFEQENCEKLLYDFEKLHLIYIEGANNNFNYKDKNFHFLEQPMTGSVLFNMIITIANIAPEIELTNQDKSEKQYSGNILVAEDNETNQILISILLKSKGLEYTIVNNGQEAVEEALHSGNVYDIMFMDINMPIMDGITATKLLREKNYKGVIISLSANIIDSDIESFKVAGVNDTLNKPIVLYELDKILNTYLTKSIFDLVDPNALSKSLSINNLDVIHKLLVSFTTTIEAIIQKIKEEGLSQELLHNIKGVTGNLRFNNLYTLSQKIEYEFDKLSKIQIQNNTNLILSHLNNLLKQISLIYK